MQINFRHVRVVYVGTTYTYTCFRERQSNTALSSRVSSARVPVLVQIFEASRLTCVCSYTSLAHNFTCILIKNFIKIKKKKQNYHQYCVYIFEKKTWQQVMSISSTSKKWEQRDNDGLCLMCSPSTSLHIVISRVQSWEKQRRLSLENSPLSVQLPARIPFSSRERENSLSEAVRRESVVVTALDLAIFPVYSPEEEEEEVEEDAAL